MVSGRTFRSTAFALAVLSVVLVAPSPAGAAVLTFGPTDDSTVRESRPTQNYGAGPVPEVDTSSRKDALLRFDVTGVGGSSVTSATLRLFTVDSSPVGGDLAIVPDTSWSENSVTGRTHRPATADPSGRYRGVSAGNWYEIDVTPLVSGDGPVSLRLSSTNANGADYASKEHSNGNQPQLVIETS